MTTDDHICTIEEAAALKFKPVGDPLEPMQSLDEWLERARQDYVTMSLVMPILESSDEAFEERIRSNDDPEGICKALMKLTDNVIALSEHYQDALDVTNSALARLMAVLARFADDDATKAGSA